MAGTDTLNGNLGNDTLRGGAWQRHARWRRWASTCLISRMRRARRDDLTLVQSGIEHDGNLGRGSSAPGLGTRTSIGNMEGSDRLRQFERRANRLRPSWRPSLSAAPVLTADRRNRQRHVQVPQRRRTPLSTRSPTSTQLHLVPAATSSTSAICWLVRRTTNTQRRKRRSVSRHSGKRQRLDHQHRS